jgi:hypothetical protein
MNNTNLFNKKDEQTNEKKLKQYIENVVNELEKNS